MLRPRLRYNLLQRRFASARPTADELLRRPILDRTRADPDTLQDLDAFPVPLLPRQLSEALRQEFDEPITTATDWSLFPGAERAAEESRGDLYRAARLLHETLASRRNRAAAPTATGFIAPARQPSDPASLRQWIRQECEQLYRELQSGSTERFEAPEHLIPAEYRSRMTAEQIGVAQPALHALAKASKLHPEVKQEVMGHICSVILRSK